MRVMKAITAGTTLTLALAGLVACSDEAEEPAGTFQGSAATSSMTTTTQPSSEPSSETVTEEAPPVIVDVPEEKFTPADGPNARLFQLEDGVTQCFLNDIAGDQFLACTTEIVDAPMVPDGMGEQAPANAVSWNPNGVTFEVLQFPAVESMETLHPNERLTALGYTCTAFGPSTVECSGAPGTATIDNGTVIGATVPELEEPPVPEAPAPEAPAESEVPSLELPLPEELFHN